MNLFLPIQSPSLLNSKDTGYLYKEHRPNNTLSPYAACYWSLDYYASNQQQTHRVLPDGCVDIIFDLTAPSLSKGAFVTGLMTRFEALTFSSNQHFLGIRLFSNHARCFIKYPVLEFQQERVNLEDIWGEDALRFTEEIQEAQGTKERIEKVEIKLTQLLKDMDNPSGSELLQTSMQYIYSGNGMNSIQSLANQLSYSERNIRRTFQRELGISPKEFSRVIRFQSLLKELHLTHHPNLTNIALKYGYYDQAHFINEFKQFYGLVPGIVFPSRKK
ncbi:helix-turn-helix transcriptional regulator [Halobacillus sp. A5]|uniref:helix-turn-helix transcriptional regulator n=1 Tax=Halobacillus sp. A5 TaxID=2880263 RepID=UPI0020A6C3D1|nr:helix-turn-helix transcriptional regulator [Halobacillus sp. A5]MCP3027760.1 helix-turn-helix transcriptional regulator [Halobacillus sp. A5]